MYFTRFNREISSSTQFCRESLRHRDESVEVCLIWWVSNAAVDFLLVHNNTNAIQKIDESAAQIIANTCTLLTDGIFRNLLNDLVFQVSKVSNE